MNASFRGLIDTNLALVHQKLQLLKLLVQYVLATLQIFLPLLLQLCFAFRIILFALRPHALFFLLHRTRHAICVFLFLHIV
jgi:hypothetical protein